MASYQITEGLIAEEKGLPTDVDVDSESDDSDLSSEEEFSPEPEESIQGPSTGFSERGPFDVKCAGAPKQGNKDKNTLPPIAPPRKTTQPPPKNKPSPANYPAGQAKPK
ncbi:hypothetical protein BDR06DRAFT_1003202 [Suillus hirtellus]|nr:hypothetical protein BDR06DRAFT_1003202 [Suillus hirtellus]